MTGTIYCNVREMLSAYIVETNFIKSGIFPEEYKDPVPTWKKGDKRVLALANLEKVLPMLEEELTLPRIALG